MKREHTYRVRRTAGFTLVELIVVLVMVSVIAGFAVPTFLGFVDDNKAKQCEINRKKVVSYLEDMLVTNPDATLGDVLNTYRKEDGDQDIDKDFTRCPVTGKGYTWDGNTVVCEAHGETTAVKRSDKKVTAKLDNALKEEKQTEAGGGIPEPEGGGNNTLEPNKPEQTAKLEVEINPNPLSLKVNDTKQLYVTITQRNCSNFQYQWTVPNENLVTNGSSNESSISLTGKQAGNVTVTCTVTAFGADGKEITAKATAIVTVEELQKFEVEVNNLNLIVGETAALQAKLTSNFQPENLQYAWTIKEGDYAELLATSGESIETKGVKAGTCVIECKVTAVYQGQQIDASATAQVIVSEKPETITEEFAINGWNAPQLNRPIWTYAPSDLPKDGIWSYEEEDGKVWFQNNHDIYIEDNFTQGTYPVHYRVGAKDYLFNVKVVYPVWGLSMSNTIDVTLGSSTEIKAELNAWYSTGRPTLRFTSSNPNVVEVQNDTRRSEEKADHIANEYVSIQAKSVGTATITATVDDPYGQYNNNKTKYEVSIQVKVVYPQVTASAQNMYLTEGEEARDIIVTLNPSENIGDVSYTYFGYDTNIVSIQGNKISGLKQGDANVWVDVKRGNEVIAQCNFWVHVSAGANTLTGIELKLQHGLPTLQQGKTATISISPDESGDIVVCPIPATASLEGATWNNAWCGNGFLQVSGQTITAMSNGTGATTLTVQVQKDGMTYQAEAVLNVILDPQKEANTLTGIELKLQHGLPTLQQGKTATISISPDESGDIVVCPIPATVSLEGATWNNAWCGNGFLQVSGQTITAMSNGTGAATLTVQVQKDGMTYQAEAVLNVIPDPKTEMKITIDGHELTTTSWSSLQDHMKHNDISQLKPCIVESWEHSQERKYYLLKPNAVLSWDDKYERMTVKEFLQDGENMNQFVVININPSAFRNITDPNGWLYCVPDDVIKSDQSYYVSTKSYSESAQSWSDQDFRDKGFIPLFIE